MAPDWKNSAAILQNSFGSVAPSSVPRKHPKGSGLTVSRRTGSGLTVTPSGCEEGLIDPKDIKEAAGEVIESQPKIRRKLILVSGGKAVGCCTTS